MVVISYGTLRNFFEQHADTKDALNNWYRLVSQADWANFHEIKTMFNTVDAVGNDRLPTKLTIRLIALQSKKSASKLFIRKKDG